MDLMAEVKQKSDQLSAQTTLLQQCLHVRATTPEFRSFVITFVAAPFVIGVVTRLTLAPAGSLCGRLYRHVLPNWRFWSLFRLVAQKSELHR